MRRATRTMRPAPTDAPTSAVGTEAARASQAPRVHGPLPPPPEESDALALPPPPPPPPPCPHDPATVLSIVAGAIDPPALSAEITPLRHDLNGRVIVHASATPCDIDLLYWPTGARQQVRLEEVGHGPDRVWRRVDER